MQFHYSANVQYNLDPRAIVQNSARSKGVLIIVYHEENPVPITQVVERLLQEREVVGSKPGRAIPKALKMVPVTTSLGATPLHFVHLLPFVFASILVCPQ